MLKLRKKITNVVQVLTHVKEKLQFIQAETVNLKNELKQLDEEVTIKRDSLPSLKNVGPCSALQTHNLTNMLGSRQIKINKFIAEATKWTIRK